MLQDAQALEQDGLDVSRLGKYLDICLEKSAKSRQLYSDRALEQEAFSFLESRSISRRESSRGDQQSIVYEDRYNDGVYPVYARLAAACPAVLAHAPTLGAYMRT